MSGTDTVWVFKGPLRSPNLPHFHADGELTTQTRHTHCGRLIATWPSGQQQLWRAAEVNLAHAKAFAVPCSSCFSTTGTDT